MRIFIAGIMQGSRTDREIDTQAYRREIARILRCHFPAVEIIDPLLLHPNSVHYPPALAKETFLAMTALAGQVDALIAYLPAASMGTAIEMWQAYQNGVPVYTISPLSANWVVQSLSMRTFHDIEAFATFVADGGLAELDRAIACS